MEYMSDGEIITFYRQAADRKKQISILAELNATSKEVITFILRRAGVLNELASVKAPPQKPAAPKVISPPKTTPPVEKEEKPKRRGGRKMDPVRHQQILSLYNQGLGDREIAAKVGLANGSSVCLWRKKYNLPPNHTQGSRRKVDRS